MEKIKVAFVISHPIQYYVPILAELTRRGNIALKVFYTWGEDSISKFDPGFNRVVQWDIPLLEGYEFEFLENIATDKGTHHFNGIDNPNIINRINEFAPDKIVVFGWSFKSHLKVLRYFKDKVPIYFRGDSHLLNKHSFVKDILRRAYLRWVYSHIDYAISVGTNNKEYYRWAGLKDKNILFAPHAIDEKIFLKNITVHETEAIALREKLSIPHNHVVFIYTGKFEYRKNLNVLVDAKINLKGKNCTLLMVGNGPDEVQLKSKCKVDNDIHFIEFINQSKMPMIYKTADVFVLPSISETWGLGINEAMNCGLAVLASNKVGSAVDLVKENGFIFEYSNANDLSDKMLYFIENKAKLEEMKRKSLSIIKEWSMDELVQKLENILLKNV